MLCHSGVTSMQQNVVKITLNGFLELEQRYRSSAALSIT